MINNRSIFKAYMNMMASCYDDTDTFYHRYGKQGVVPCEDWFNDYSVFEQWVNTQLQADVLDKEGYIPVVVIKGPSKVFGPDTCELYMKEHVPIFKHMPYTDGEEEEPQPETAPMADEQIYLTIDEYQKRQDICDTCEFLEGTKCTKYCKNCSGDLHASRRRDIKCPVGKW